MGKILKHIIHNRKLTCAEAGGALSDLKYGFKKGQSTINEVDVARDAVEGERWRFDTKGYWSVVTLDELGRIMRALFNLATQQYLIEILNNYFQERKVICIPIG